MPCWETDNCKLGFRVPMGMEEGMLTGSRLLTSIRVLPLSLQPVNMDRKA